MGAVGVWCLWAIAALTQKEVVDRRQSSPEGHRGGVSILPVIPLFPLAAWAIALLLDLFVAPWGTWIIGVAHAALAVLFIVSIARNWWRLRSLNRVSGQ